MRISTWLSRGNGWLVWKDIRALIPNTKEDTMEVMRIVAVSRV